MIIIINLSSTKSDELGFFCDFLIDKLNKIKNEKFIALNTIKNIKLKNKFSVLKSPHVNNKAKEQFEIVTYRRTIKIYSYKNLLLLFALKQVVYKLTANIKSKIYVKYSAKKLNKYIKSDFNLDNVYLKRSGLSQNQYKSYLKQLDIFGEINLKL